MTSPRQAPRSAPRWRRFLRARLERDSYLGLHLTAGLAVVASGVWLFGGLLEEVLDSDALVRWDVATAGVMHSATTSRGIAVFAAITNLGSPLAMSALAVIGVMTTIALRQRLLAAAWAAAAAGGALVDAVLKMTIHRTRPEFAAAFLHGSSYSFPSGHAMGSVIGYGFLAYAIVKTRQRRGWQRALAFAAATLLALLIGVSRVYLGVHYPSDVAGGWAAGLAWLAVCVTGYEVGAGRATRRRSTLLQSGTP